MRDIALLKTTYRGEDVILFYEGDHEKHPANHCINCLEKKDVSASPEEGEMEIVNCPDCGAGLVPKALVDRKGRLKRQYRPDNGGDK